MGKVIVRNQVATNGASETPSGGVVGCGELARTLAWTDPIDEFWF